MIIPDKWMQDNTPYTPQDIDMICAKVKRIASYTHDGKIKYLNIPVSFDTETTSFYDKNGEKTAIVYVWMLGICGMVIMGRTMDEWLYTYNRICYNFRTYGKKRYIIIYVHNLQFDFQFIRKYHTFDTVFAMGKYEPLYARTVEGVEFRCSYRLSGYRLETIADNLKLHSVKKLIGDLDYRQLRHTQTPLTKEEIMYCINDVKIVCAYIAEKMEDEKDISTIPLTKTGYVRRYCRNYCFKYNEYKSIIKSLTLTPQEFLLCKSAFGGGYTHANANYVSNNTIVENAVSNDIISSYPGVLFMEQFPMSAPVHVVIHSITELEEYCEKYCCIFTITLHRVYPQPGKWFDFYLSSSKCKMYGKRNISNGRIVSCDQLTTTITNVDYRIIKYMYEYDMDNIYINEFIYFERDYLPTPFVRAMLELYQKKTELKGVKGKETEYAVIKENQNSFYGMAVTSPIRPIYNYNGEWEDEIEPDLESALKIYNNGFNRFLYYPWGVFCTAYARYNIWSAIIECGIDHIYTDTDSEKCANFDKHKDFFIEYNNTVYKKLQLACKCHNIPIEMCIPKTINGESKMLGAFEIDGVYTRFKTQGAKRYLYEDKKGIHAVVAGMNPKTGVEYITSHYENAFDAFEDGLIIPSGYSGRMVHTYIDESREGELTDMYGITAHYKQLSAVHLAPAPYTMGISGEFIRAIKFIKESEVIE